MNTTPDSPPTDAELLNLAEEAAHHAWAPYSSFPVENASSPLGICAERNAAAHMVTTADVTATDGHLPSIPQIKAVAIVGLKSAPCYPCGACRQVLREFNCERVIVSVDGKPRSHDFAEILPHSFGPESL